MTDAQRPFYAMRFIRGETFDLPSIVIIIRSARKAPGNVRWNFVGCWHVSFPSATPSPMPTIVGSCIAM